MITTNQLEFTNNNTSTEESKLSLDENKKTERTGIEMFGDYIDTTHEALKSKKNSQKSNFYKFISELKNKLPLTRIKKIMRAVTDNVSKIILFRKFQQWALDSWLEPVSS
jgi:hypothetical protein